MSPSYNLTKIHVVGHSLGAQVAASIGNKLKETNITLTRITGLDPAGMKVFDKYE
jgi:pimeloyl-ACP methyl ester carboxylesterase